MAAPAPASTDDAAAFLAAARAEVDAFLERVLPPIQGPAARLAEAMRYSVLAGGKRLRPALAMACCQAVGGEARRTLPFGAALELVHTYSLIHDDLPAMDDDDLRRGRPTSHRVFGEALAILAGDALHTLAFEVLLDAPLAPELLRLLALDLAHAAGERGMVGGQVEDIQASGGAADEESLLRIQGRKTGALIAAACRGGARLGGADAASVEAIDRFGRHLGLAFQMADDVLDETGTAAALGKTPGKDRAADRMTWVSLLGVEEARRRCEREVDLAMEAVAGVPGLPLLAGLARFVSARDR